MAVPTYMTVVMSLLLVNRAHQVSPDRSPVNDAIFCDDSRVWPVGDDDDSPARTVRLRQRRYKTRDLCYVVGRKSLGASERTGFGTVTEHEVGVLHDISHCIRILDADVPG